MPRYPAIRVIGLVCVLTITPFGPTLGQDAQKAQSSSPAAAQKASPQPTSKPPPIGVPPVKNLLIMIRTTLVALHQANITNNYSVLRDLGAPSFQQANSVERLSAAFADLRTRGGDIAPVVLALPTLSRPAAIDQNGMLRLTGAFDTKPNELAFDLAFQVVDGFWRLDGIAVQFRAPTATTADGASNGQPKNPDDEPKAKPKTASKSQKRQAQ
ncbi:MAG TPA: hypothetical protein VHC71_05970 [Hyphomicrobium sp.]|nr:hypothetical protein [Hyphomicrobium sp.]